MNQLLHPLFLWPLLCGFFIGVGFTMRVVKREIGHAANLDER